MWILGVMFVIGVWEALKGAYRTASRSRSSSRPQRAQGQSPAARRARTQHDMAWWARELFTGIPDTRHGFRSGWQAHNAAVTQKDTEHHEARAGWAQQLADYRRRREAAQEQIDRAQPVTQPADVDGQVPPLPADQITQPHRPVTYPPDGPPSAPRCPECGLRTFHKLDCSRRQRDSTEPQPYGAPEHPGGQPAAGEPHGGCPHCGCGTAATPTAPASQN